MQGYIAMLRANEQLFQTDQSLQTTQLFLPAYLFVFFQRAELINMFSNFLALTVSQ